MREKERRAGPQRQQEVATQRQRQVPGSVCPAARLVTRVRFLGTGRTVVVSLEDMNTDTKSCSFFLTKSLAVKKRRSSGLQMVCVCACAHACTGQKIHALVYLFTHWKFLDHGWNLHHQKQCRWGTPGCSWLMFRWDEAERVHSTRFHSAICSQTQVASEGQWQSSPWTGICRDRLG